jgi:hypothetical protein
MERLLTWCMTRRAAHKLARLVRAQGFKVRLRRRGATWACVFYTVHQL